LETYDQLYVITIVITIVVEIRDLRPAVCDHYSDYDCCRD
jgi:hypothetical protein